MKIIKGEKLRVGKNAHISETGFIGIGIIIIIPVLISFINAIFTSNLTSNIMAFTIIFGGVAVALLCFGIKLKLEQKRYVDKFLYLKENGKKTTGKIIKGYSYGGANLRDNVNNYPREFYQLKIRYYDEFVKKNGIFLTPPISGSINNICSDEIEVYYFNGEAVIDNLKKGDSCIEFNEGIHVGPPYTETIKLEQSDNMDINEFQNLINELKKEEKNNFKDICNSINYEE